MKIVEILTSVPDADTCTIYAISHVAAIPPDKVWEFAESLWKMRFGMHSGQVDSVLKKLGFEMGRFRYDLVYKPRKFSYDPYHPWTLGQLLKKLQETPTEPLLIFTRGHLIGYRDGIIMDVGNTGHKSRIESVYEVEKI
jgi:hypothetical protein